jgi:diguanylate cyclase (GGDEF)-like protein/PAS domain S-box-containing protein
MSNVRVGPEALLEALDCAGDAVAVLGPAEDGQVRHIRFAFVNRAFERLYQCPASEVIGLTLERFFEHRAPRERFEQVVEIMTRNETESHTRELPRPDGSSVWIEVNTQRFGTGYWIYVARDITDSRANHVRMTQLLSAVERASEPIAIYKFEADEWRYDFVNEAFLILTGFRREDVVGQLASVMNAEQTDLARIQRSRSLLMNGETVRGEVTIHRKDGSFVVLEYTSKPLVDDVTREASSVVTVFHDVTDTKHHRERLERQAHYDALTGIYNRYHMEQKLAEAIARSDVTAEQAFVFIDLDGFKAINDRYGHDRGDEILRNVAQAFQSCVWGSDILARWGGDEFAALIFHCGIDDARRIGERFIKTLTLESEVGASVGVTMLRGSVAETLRRADAACYEAKRAGGNKVVMRLDNTERNDHY